jgi:hypothetical protein
VVVLIGRRKEIGDEAEGAFYTQRNREDDIDRESEHSFNVKFYLHVKFNYFDVRSGVASA